MGEPKGYIVVPLAENPDDELRSLEVDAKDNLKVSVEIIPTTTVIPHADEKLFGFEDRVLEYKEWSENQTYAFISFTAVPTGKIHVITSICAYNNDNATTGYVKILVSDDTNIYYIKSKAVPVAKLDSIDFQGELYLKAGDFVEIRFYGVTAWDTIDAAIFGYQMNAP